MVQLGTILVIYFTTTSIYHKYYQIIFISTCAEDHVDIHHIIPQSSPDANDN